MKHSSFTLTISRVDGPLYEGDANSATFPGAAGQLTVLAKHEPLIALLKKGKISVQSDGETKEFEIERGLLEVSHNHVTVLV